MLQSCRQTTVRLVDHPAGISPNSITLSLWNANPTPKKLVATSPNLLNANHLSLDVYQNCVRCLSGKGNVTGEPPRTYRPSRYKQELHILIEESLLFSFHSESEL